MADAVSSIASTAGKAAETSTKMTMGTIIGAGIGLGLNTIFTVRDYKANRAEGHGVIGSAIRAGKTFVFNDFMGMKMIPYTLALSGYQLSKAAGQAKMQGMERMYDRAGKFGSGYAPMSEAGYTMRQRSLNAIRQNGLNVQSVLGNEARQYYGRY